MDTIFTLRDVGDTADKVNLDELYEKKKQQDLNTLSTYNKILARIHDKIKLASRQSVNNQWCCYIIPEFMIGIPKYDHGACTAYLIDKLKENGFVVRYTHPNLLFISWKHWIPSYVRTEIKKKTGIVVDGHGNKIDETNKINDKPQTTDDINAIMLQKNSKTQGDGKTPREFKDINSYKPTGSLVYSKELLKKLEDKLS